MQYLLLTCMQAKAAVKKKKKAAGSDSEMEEASDDDYAPAKVSRSPWFLLFPEF